MQEAGSVDLYHRGYSHAQDQDVGGEKVLCEVEDLYAGRYLADQLYYIQVQSTEMHKHLRPHVAVEAYRAW